jgi:hypothetical protein
MLPLTLDSAGVEAFAFSWSELMAVGEMQAACDLLDEPRGDGRRWTPELLRESIEIDHFGPGTVFSKMHPDGVIYSDPHAVQSKSPHRNVVGRLDDGEGYWLDWDLPLNGEWSDLTAQFLFTRSDEGFRVCLYDLHVM